MNYHAHIYWKNNAQRDSALSLRAALQELGCGIGSVHDKPIGPHPLPMYQVMYDSNQQKEVEDFLSKTTLTILLHEDVGVDHVRDHTDGARWLNGRLDLDLQSLVKRFRS